ncbi:MAG TPA: class I SAM-dependent DNA methyltransferase [Tepidisphaeraceae bacterium]|nr:class I SAM-dependent DNA methyltransferase [Tepidisphaeraceae bacterium]
MRSEAAVIVQKVWSYANVLKDDGLAFIEYTEQITYLLFLKMSHERSEEDPAQAIPSQIGWNSLLKRSGTDLAAHYTKVLVKLSEMPGLLGTIFAKPQSKINDPAKLALLIRLINEENWSSLDVDVKGEIYEGLIARNAEDVRGGAGQYFTPRPVIRAIVKAMNLSPKDRVSDPACGTGGFLLGAYEAMRGRARGKKETRFLHEEAITGWDIVSNVVRLCAMNLYLHGLGGENGLVITGDSLAKPPSPVDVVLTNPPFGQKSSITVIGKGGRQQKDRITYDRPDFWATTSNKQLNFLQHVYTMLTNGGRAAVVVPDNVMFASGAGETIRRQLLNNCNVHTILRLPTGIWYSPSVQANVLFFDKTAPGADVWVYDLRTNMNFSLRERPIADSDLEEFVVNYETSDRRLRKESERFRRFSREALLARPKVNLNLAWLRDNSLPSASDLADPDEIAASISEDLRLALAEFEQSRSKPL